jgi:hypothetical protein
MTESDLQKRLEKLGAQLVSDIESWEKRTRGDRTKALDELSHSLGGALGEVVHTIAAEAEKAKQRDDERKARKAERKREREARNPPSVAVGVVFLTAAVLCAVMGILNPQLWWMVFVALGLGLSGAGQVASASRRKRALGPEPTPAPERPAVHEVDGVCDQLLADLEASPDAVKQFISEPKKTVTVMRTTLKALDQRRQQLLGEDATGRLQALATQRTSIEARRAATTDPETLQRMNEALHSMDGQREALEQLRVATDRVDGEYTSLLVHLQELRTRVAVAKSTSSHVQLEGLKASVQRLNDELGAISEAMEAVRRGDVAPVSEVGGATSREGVRVRE